MAERATEPRFDVGSRTTNDMRFITKAEAAGPLEASDLLQLNRSPNLHGSEDFPLGHADHII